MAKLRLGIVGVGVIVREQHVPALDNSDDFTLVATASRSNTLPNVASYRSMEEMISAEQLDAVSICTPPEPRYQMALNALEAGLHVMLEKPPAATLSQAFALDHAAKAAGRTLHATWHSREAEAVTEAAAWLANRRIHSAKITWKEDVRHWHPGQEWIFAPGGFGVFDPGINALSIMTHILPAPLTMESAKLTVPAGRAAPIHADLTMRSDGAPITAEFDFLQTGPQTWSIEVETDAGPLVLTDGGNSIVLPGEEPRTGQDCEYPRLYAQFAQLIRSGKSDVDLRPLSLVADAFLIGSVAQGPSFEF